jgi:uncharacterized alkaline shock family protein YloU
MAEANMKETYIIPSDSGLGEIGVGYEVVAVIAGIAATETDGVASMAGGITADLVGKLGMSTLSKGVKVEVSEKDVLVELSLNIKRGYSMKEVCEDVQDKVKVAIENMTGLNVVRVNIKVAGVEH